MPSRQRRLISGLVILLADREITATTLMASNWLGWTWQWGPFFNDDAATLLPHGRLLIVVAISLSAALISLLFSKRPDPQRLVEFYRRVRPVGFWGPVRACLGAEDSFAPEPLLPIVTGVVGGLAAIYGTLFLVGALCLGVGDLPTAIVAAAVGVVLVMISLSRMK